MAIGFYTPEVRALLGAHPRPIPAAWRAEDVVRLRGALRAVESHKLEQQQQLVTEALRAIESHKSVSHVARLQILRACRRCYRGEPSKATLLFVRLFPSSTSRKEDDDVKDTITELVKVLAERLLKAFLQVKQIKQLQTRIQLLVATLLRRLQSKAVRPVILASDWLKSHGPRPPRTSANAVRELSLAGGFGVFALS